MVDWNKWESEKSDVFDVFDQTWVTSDSDIGASWLFIKWYEA